MRNYEIDSVNKTVVFDFTYEAEMVKRVKSCSYNARWNPELKHWVVPIDEYSKPNILALIKNYGFSTAAQKEQNNVEYSYKIANDDMNLIIDMCQLKNFAYTPREYQYEALAYALQKKNIINGDDVGLGKTFEAIMYTELSMSFPCLVITPASVKYNWAEKWAEIVGDQRSISVITSKEEDNDWTADVVIINYDIIGKKQGTGATVKFAQLVDTDWRMKIFDEAHFLKSTKSQRSKAAAKIVKGDGRVQLLTGTATMNKPVELWNLLKLIDREKYIANDWMQFVLKYCGGYKGKFGWVTDGATNTLELNKLIREVCYLRREKVDVLKELPEVTKQVFKTHITNRKAYGKALDNIIEYIRETAGEEKAEKAMEAEHLVAMGTLRKLAISGKLKAIEQYLKDWKEVNTEKLVIFGLHREGLEYLSNKFKSTLIAGGIPIEKKHKLVKDFCKNDELFLFGNIESMGTGVDGLQYICSNMLIVELPWRPSDLEQLIGRLYRSGQTLPVMATFMLADETIDEDMWNMLAEKEQVTEAVNKGIDVTRNKSGLKSVMSKMLKRAKKKK